MIKRTMWVGMGLLLAAAVVASGDIVILQNGDRIEGEIVSESPSEVVIKRTFRSGIKFTDKIERSKIVRIEKSEGGQEPSTATAASSESPESQPASSLLTLTDADRKRLLDEAITHWEKQEYTNTGMLLSRLINASSTGELKELSAEVEKRLNLSLGDMAAEAHLQAAITRSRGSSVTLQYVTEYEWSYLVPRLINTYEEAIKTPARLESTTTAHPRAKTKTTAKTESPQGMPREDVPAAPESETPSPTSQPTVGPVIADYLDNPQTFTGDREQAIALARQIRFALSLLSARMRYDSDYRSKPEVREELLKEKNKLLALQKEVLAKTGEAAAAKEREAKEKELLLNQQQRDRQMRPGGPGGPGGHPGGRAGQMLMDIRRQQEIEAGAAPPPPPPGEQ